MYQKHFRVQESNNKFANKHENAVGIDSFCASDNTRVVAITGQEKPRTLFLYLNEREVLFSDKGKALYKFILKMLRQNLLAMHVPIFCCADWASLRSE